MNKKVYVVEFLTDVEEIYYTPVEVFSTKEKAENFIKENSKDWGLTKTDKKGRTFNQYLITEFILK